MNVFNWITTSNIGLIWLSTTSAILASQILKKGMGNVLLKEVFFYFLYSGLALFALLFLVVLFQVFVDFLIEIF